MRAPRGIPPGPAISRWKTRSTGESSKIGVRGRTCIGCRLVRPKGQMVRLVRGTSGAATVDATGAAPGRGAYICPTEQCFERGRRRIAGALRGATVNADAIKDQLDAYSAEHGTRLAERGEARREPRRERVE